MDLIVMGILGYVSFIGIILLVSHVKANQCECQRTEYGCKC